MTRHSYDKHNCPIAQTLGAVGDQWTLLIVRDVLGGRRRFEDFQESLGISRNLLSSRLKQMVAEGLLVREQIPGSRRFAYRPTDKCKELRKVLYAMAEWGKAWRNGPEVPRVLLEEKDSGAPVSLEYCRIDTGAVVDGAAVRAKFNND